MGYNQESFIFVLNVFCERLHDVHLFHHLRSCVHKSWKWFTNYSILANVFKYWENYMIYKTSISEKLGLALSRPLCSSHSKFLWLKWKSLGGCLDYDKIARTIPSVRKQHKNPVGSPVSLKTNRVNTSNIETAMIWFICTKFTSVPVYRIETGRWQQLTGNTTQALGTSTCLCTSCFASSPVHTQRHKQHPQCHPIDAHGSLHSETFLHHHHYFKRSLVEVTF